MRHMEILAMMEGPQTLPQGLDRGLLVKNLERLLAERQDATVKVKEQSGATDVLEAYLGEKKARQLAAREDFFNTWGEIEVKKFRCILSDIIGEVIVYNPDSAQPTRFATFLHPFDVKLLPEYSKFVKNPMCLALLGARIHSGYYDYVPQKTSEKCGKRTSLQVCSKWLEFQQDLLDVFFNAIIYHCSYNAFGEEARMVYLTSGIEGAKFAIECVNRAVDTIDSVCKGLPLAYSGFLTSARQAVVPEGNDDSARLEVAQLVTGLHNHENSSIQLFFQKYRLAMQAVDARPIKDHPLQVKEFLSVFKDALPSSLSELEILLAHGKADKVPALESVFSLHHTVELMCMFLVVSGLPGECTQNELMEIKSVAMDLRNSVLPEVVMDAMAEVVRQRLPSDEKSSRKRNREASADESFPGQEELALLLSLVDRRDPWKGTLVAPPDAESELGKLSAVVQELSQANFIFAYPPIELRDYAYKAKISQPMDFFTIKYKLLALKAYPSGAADILKEIDIMYDNSIAYNGIEGQSAHITLVIQSIRQNFHKMLEAHGLKL